MTESPKLLPCPWCGAFRPRINVGRFFDAPSVRYRAVCVTEGCCSQTGWHASEVGAAEAWNKRAPDHEREAMARVCEAARNVSEVERRYLRAPSDMSASALGGSVAKMRVALADLERARKGEG